MAYGSQYGNQAYANIEYAYVPAGTSTTALTIDTGIPFSLLSSEKNDNTALAEWLSTNQNNSPVPVENVASLSASKIKPIENIGAAGTISTAILFENTASLNAAKPSTIENIGALVNNTIAQADTITAGTMTISPCIENLFYQRSDRPGPIENFSVAQNNLNMQVEYYGAALLNANFPAEFVHNTSTIAGVLCETLGSGRSDGKQATDWLASMVQIIPAPYELTSFFSIESAIVPLPFEVLINSSENIVVITCDDIFTFISF